ncbi:MAG: hypothetical protein GY947_20405, partial [Rhodobacteraceae bacterium]|nr:hypothetical protein [Paracoccaceae bacterium]
SGPLAGFPVIDFKVELLDGKYHDVDSSVMAFEIAGRMGMREGMKKAGQVVLEPIMSVNVTTPNDCATNVIADLIARRGVVQDRGQNADPRCIRALVPLSNMFGYINALLSMSAGRATFTMLYLHHQVVPGIGGDRDDDPPVAVALGR